jgi:hypothetical protein
VTELRKRGHLPDHPAIVAARPSLAHFSGYRAMRADPLPLETHNRDTLPTAAGGPGIPDQDGVGGCEGMAHRTGIGLRLALEGTPIAPLSGAGLYLGALLVSRQRNADGTWPGLFDTGTMPSAILQALAFWGACSDADWGVAMTAAALYLNGPSDPSDAPELVEPSPEQLFAESLFRMKGAYFVQSSGDQKALDIMAALAARRPVSIALPASGPAFQGYRGGVLTAAQLTGPVDHANVLVDFKWNGTDLSTLELFDANSWSESWGESDVAGLRGGLARFDRSCVDILQSALVLDVERA